MDDHAHGFGLLLCLSSKGKGIAVPHFRVARQTSAELASFLNACRSLVNAGREYTNWHVNSMKEKRG
jgi:hypothetical protein